MSETTPLIKAALNLRVGVGFDVYEYSMAVVANRTFSILCLHLSVKRTFYLPYPLLRAIVT